MAVNTLTDIMPKILARALLVLREKTMMPRLVNGDYSSEAAEKGDTIDVPISAAVAVIDVTPSNTPPAGTALTPTKVQITLDNWKQNEPFFLTDNEMVQIDRSEHFLPMQIQEAVSALAIAVNNDIFAEYKGVYGYVGTAGITPFGSGVGVLSATNAIATLNRQKCPKATRRAVVDFTCEAQMLALSEFRDVDKSGSNTVAVEGEIGRKYGIDWYSDDSVPTHTAGTAASATTNTAGYAVGVKTITLASAGTGTILVGDIITFAGHTQTYAVTSGDADVSGGGTISFYPGLKVALAASAIAITLKASHVVNLVFHREAFAFATRPLVSETQDLGLGHQILSFQDPDTGLVLRLEVSRQHKRTAWEFDILWGAKLVRPELACRIAG